MAKMAKNYVAHQSIPKKTSQASKKRKCKMSSMNKHHMTTLLMIFNY